jgi:hypothetical protein
MQIFTFPRQARRFMDASFIKRMAGDGLIFPPKNTQTIKERESFLPVFDTGKGLIWMHSLKPVRKLSKRSVPRIATRSRFNKKRNYHFD